jgi:hypothetical protein
MYLITSRDNEVQPVLLNHGIEEADNKVNRSGE